MMGQPGMTYGPPLTAEEASMTVFNTVRRDGLDPFQVDRFRRRVIEALRRCEEQRARPMEAVDILWRAQKTAEGVVENARTQALHVVNGSREQADGILADSLGKAARIVQQALDDAGHEAARVAAQAPVKAQEELARYQALAAVAVETLTANLAALTAQVERWKSQQERASTAVLLSADSLTSPDGHPSALRR